MQTLVTESGRAGAWGWAWERDGGVTQGYEEALGVMGVSIVSIVEVILGVYACGRPTELYTLKMYSLL